jgi:ABC-2 type transport system permease protein
MALTKEAPKKNPSCAKSSKKSSGNRSFWVLYRKELADHLNSKRFFLAFGLLFAISAVSLYTAVSSISDALSENSTFIFLRLYTTGKDSIYSFATFMAYLGPLVGIMLGFDAVNNERALGTLNRLASQPIYRDSIINAKFLAGTTVIFTVITFLGLCFGGAGLLLIGIPPTGEEALRAIVFILLSSVYVSFWLALSTVFSVVCKHIATSAIGGIAVWMFLTMFMANIVNSIVQALYPADKITNMADLIKNYTLQLNLSRLSPYYLFVEASTTIMDPSIRSIGLVTQSQMNSVIPTPIALEQSLMLIWPHLVVITALVIVCFTFAYVKFMRQEIRA